jgi:polyisoprenyl-teichoic acid--peptidoglycan teichoic acid transferase
VEQVTESTSYRTQRRHAKKKGKGKLLYVAIAIAALIIVFAVLGGIVKVSPIDKAWKKTMNGFGWVGHQIKSAWPFKGSKKVVAADFMPDGKKTANYLIAITKQAGGATFLSTTVLASYDARDKTASLVFFPNDLLVAPPGMGSDQLSNLVELDGGRVTSTQVTAENVLGTNIDRYVLASDRDLRMILTQLGSKFTVDVPSKISYKDPSLNVTVDLKPGKQSLNPTVLASYLTYGPAGKSLDLARRQAAFAPALVSMLGSTDVNKFIAKNANMFDTNASNKELAGILTAFARAKGGALQTGIIPVKEFRFEKTVVNRVDQAALAGFVQKFVKSSASGDSGARVKVEILNGNGVPGIGEKVAEKIDLSKYQIVNSANADNFLHPITAIIVYSDDKAIVNAANELKNELEIGDIVSQPKGQDLSDITVIVGQDYAKK